MMRKPVLLVILPTAIVFLFSLTSYSQSWYHKKFVDDFGDVTDEDYVVTHVTGTFNNTATRGSCLLVSMVVTVNERQRPVIRFDLTEYCSSSNPTVILSKGGKLKIKDSAGNKQTFSLNSQGIMIGNDYDALMLVRLLRDKNQVVRMLIQENGYANSEYFFDINSSGFANAFNQLSGLNKSFNNDKKEHQNTYERVLAEDETLAKRQSLLLDKPNWKSNQLIRIGTGDTVQILTNYQGGYIEVRVGSQQGYVKASDLNGSTYMQNIIEIYEKYN